MQPCAMLINHGPTIREWFDVQPPKLEVLREVEFAPDDSFPENLDEQARAILAYLNLEGANRVMPAQSNARQLKIFRMCAQGNYIITWNRIKKKIVVQQQKPFSFLRLVNFLHFKGGYGQPYPAHVLWAVIVDLVAVSIAFWVVSGIYIWRAGQHNAFSVVSFWLAELRCLLDWFWLFAVSWSSRSARPHRPPSYPGRP